MQPVSSKVHEENAHTFGLTPHSHSPSPSNGAPSAMDNVILSAPASLASVGLGTTVDHTTSLESRQSCFILVREKQDDTGFGFHFTVNVDRSQNSSGGKEKDGARIKMSRRMSTSFRHIVVQKNELAALVKNWKEGGFMEKTGGGSGSGHGTSGPQGRRNSQFFDGRAVDAEMRAWIGELTNVHKALCTYKYANTQLTHFPPPLFTLFNLSDTGVPPSRGSIIRFIIWRIEIADETPGGLRLAGGVENAHKVRKSSFTMTSLGATMEMHEQMELGGEGASSTNPNSNPTNDGSHGDLMRATKSGNNMRRGSTAGSYIPQALELEMINKEANEQELLEYQSPTASPTNNKPKRATNIRGVDDQSEASVHSEEVVGVAVNIVPFASLKKVGVYSPIVYSPPASDRQIEAAKEKKVIPKSKDPKVGKIMGKFPPRRNSLEKMSESDVRKFKAAETKATESKAAGGVVEKKEEEVNEAAKEAKKEEPNAPKESPPAPKESPPPSSSPTSPEPAAFSPPLLRELQHTAGHCSAAKALAASENKPYVEPCLRDASKEGKLEVVKDLIRTGKELDEHTNLNGQTPLALAARYGHVEVCRELVDAGAGVDIADNDGWTPLIEAAFYGQLQSVKFLVGETKADINMTTKNGYTPLGNAIIKKHDEIEEYLRNMGAMTKEEMDANVPVDTPAPSKGKGGGASGRKKARQTDAGATKQKLKELQGAGPVEEEERRAARITDAGATLAQIQQLQGSGPVEEEEERRAARITDAGATLAQIQQLQGSGPVEEEERRAARITDAGATLAQIQQLQGSGPVEVEERRAARITDAGATLAQIQELHIPSPAPELERRDARITDAGATLAQIQQLNAAAPTSDSPERRHARITDHGQTAKTLTLLSNLEVVGEGPQEDFEKREPIRKRQESGLELSSALSEYGTGPSDLQQRRDARLTDQGVTRDQFGGFATGNLSHVQFTDVGSPDLSKSMPLYKESPTPRPSFHVAPDEEVLPDVGLDTYFGNMSDDLKGGMLGSRPGTAPANLYKPPQDTFVLPSMNRGEEKPVGLFRTSSPVNSAGAMNRSLEALRIAALPPAEVARQKQIKKQRNLARFRTVTNPFGFSEVGISGVSFGPRPNYEVEKKKKKKQGAKNVFYDRHGRRHRSAKLKSLGDIEGELESEDDGLYLKAARGILKAAGRRLKQDPRIKLKPWADGGVGHIEELREAVGYLGVTNLAEQSLESLFSFLERNGEGEGKGVSVASLLYEFVDQEGLIEKLKRSQVYSGSVDGVLGKFKPYDLRESDKIQPIVSVRHVGIVLEDLGVSGVASWQVESVCKHVCDLGGSGGSNIGSSRIVNVALLVAYLRDLCGAGSVVVEERGGGAGGRGGGARAVAPREITPKEIEHIASNPILYLEEMEKIQRRLSRLLERSGETNGGRSGASLL